MKTNRMSIVMLLALALSLGLAASAWAGPWHGGWGGGPGHMNLSPEQAGKLFDLKQKFLDDTAKLRKQMWVKRAELAELWKAEKPNDKAIVAKKKELNALRGQMIEKSVAFRLEARKIAPQMGQGFGHGMRGFGMGGPGGGVCLPGGVCPVGPGGPPPGSPAK
jgi:zinc resistance-associated protein